MAVQQRPDDLSPIAAPSANRDAVVGSVADHSTAADAGKRRVMHVSLGTHVGGMEKLLVEFARFGSRDRFDLTFISLQPRGELATEIESCGWPVISMNKRDGLRPGLVLSLAREMRRRGADVVHTHNDAALVYGVPAAKLARVPRIVHTRHGQRIAATPRQTRMFRQLSRLVSHVVGVSEDSRQMTLAEGVDPARVCAIHNGVDLTRFPLAGPNPNGGAVLVARLSPAKDVGTLIRAMSVVHSRPNTSRGPLRLDIVGDGSERDELESISRSHSMQQVIRFHGTRDDIPEILARSSMFVLPSVSEGISISLLEAMSSGLPVIACRVGGNPEVVVDDQTGILVPPRDPQALADAITRLHESPELATQMGRRGRQRTESVFSIKQMVDQYERLYCGAAVDAVMPERSPRLAG